MSKVSNLFSEAQKGAIVDAIAKAERATSAEIRVHIEMRCKGEVLDHAVAVFDRLGMRKTERHNGVLIYVAIDDRKTAIIGDSAINKCVEREFWNNCYASMKTHFTGGEYAEGICAAVAMLEVELAAHFPYQSDDVNELSDEISFGK